jgi:HSP20 family protein
MPMYSVPLRSALPDNGFRRELDRFFEDVVNARPQSAATWQPATDATEDAAGYTLLIELPGVSPSGVEVLSEDGLLTVRGTKSAPELQPGQQVAFAERTHGDFVRRFRLPKSADLQTVTASYALGVLTVRVAKLVPAQPRRVPITVPAAQETQPAAASETPGPRA